MACSYPAYCDSVESPRRQSRAPFPLSILNAFPVAGAAAAAGRGVGTYPVDPTRRSLISQVHLISDSRFMFRDRLFHSNNVSRGRSFPVGGCGVALATATPARPASAPTGPDRCARRKSGARDPPVSAALRAEGAAPAGAGAARGVGPRAEAVRARCVSRGIVVGS